jgi:hypothetical protein
MPPKGHYKSLKFYEYSKFDGSQHNIVEQVRIPMDIHAALLSIITADYLYFIYDRFSADSSCIQTHMKLQRFVSCIFVRMQCLDFCTPLHVGTKFHDAHQFLWIKFSKKKM